MHWVLPVIQLFAYVLCCEPFSIKYKKHVTLREERLVKVERTTGIEHEGLNEHCSLNSCLFSGADLQAEAYDMDSKKKC